MSRRFLKTANKLAKGHYCEKYCGLSEDIEHALDMARAEALEEAARAADDFDHHSPAPWTWMNAFADKLRTIAKQDSDHE